ncbi:MAG TPA: dihydroxyacetone kinase subunit DhaL [Spirochaetia bacterium]|nr:dihydroxyacetone kinase subunit DhaL [Spirochaetia bacterium]
MSGLDAGFWMTAVDGLVEAFAAQETALCGLDGAIGDGDHGTSMLLGFREAQASLRGHPPAAPGEVWVRTGEAFVDRVGGVTGMVFGSMFSAAGRQAADGARLDSAALHAMFAAGLAAVRRVGKVTEGDKSMLDALAPAVQALDAAARGGLSTADALGEAARAAEAGRDSTKEMEARVGRARYQARKGAGHVDAGAASVCVLFQVLGRAAARYSS